MRGNGWFFEKGGGKTSFNIEIMMSRDGKFSGRIFNETFQPNPPYDCRSKIRRIIDKIMCRKEIPRETPKEIRYPEADISGQLSEGVLLFKKTYREIDQRGYIEYKLKESVEKGSFIGTFEVWGCPAVDFNCMHCLEDGPVEIIFSAT